MAVKVILAPTQTLAGGAVTITEGSDTMVTVALDEVVAVQFVPDEVTMTLYRVIPTEVLRGV